MVHLFGARDYLTSDKLKVLEGKLSDAGFKVRYRKKDELVLQKCSLHRDKTPSLTINIAKNRYRCWSCDDKGSISKLLSYYGIKWGSYSQAATIDELESYLNECEQLDSSVESIIKNSPNQTRIELGDYKPNELELLNYKYYHPYLEGRGFDKEFILANKIGFDRDKLRVTIPIFLFDQFIGVAARTVVSDIPKISYNAGMPKDKILYIPLTCNHKSDTIVITEGPIDALKGSYYGYDTVSILGCQVSEAQMDLIYEYAVGRQIIIALDSDQPGKNGTNKFISMLPDIDDVKIFCYNGINSVIKDPGDATKNQMNYGILNAKSILDF